MKDHQLNLLQLVNATLSAAVFVSLGEGLVKAFPAPLHGAGPSFSSLPTAFMAGILILWTVKIFLDDHKSFATADRKLASYVALFFTIGSYLLLIASAAAIDRLSLSIEYLALHFGLLACWTVVSIILRLLHLEDAVDPTNEKKDFQKRLGWLLMNLIYLVLALWAAGAGTDGGYSRAIPLGVLIIVIMGDAWFSGTFLELAQTAAGTDESEDRSNPA